MTSSVNLVRFRVATQRWEPLVRSNCARHLMGTRSMVSS